MGQIYSVTAELSDGRPPVKVEGIRTKSQAKQYFKEFVAAWGFEFVKVHMVDLTERDVTESIISEIADDSMNEHPVISTGHLLCGK